LSYNKTILILKHYHKVEKSTRFLLTCIETKRKDFETEIL